MQSVSRMSKQDNNNNKQKKQLANPNLNQNNNNVQYSKTNFLNLVKDKSLKEQGQIVESKKDQILEAIPTENIN